MAAAPEIRAPDIVDLTRVRVEDLQAVLEDECISWRSVLSWDFTASADLVRRFVRIQSLSGYALVLDGRVIGYSYYVCEDRKGLIGDLYVMRDFESTANEDMLLSSVLQSLIAAPGVERIEAQLMMVRGPFERAIPYAKSAEVFPRLFMLADLEDTGNLEASPAASQYRIRQWDPGEQDGVAMTIASAYYGHVDSRINDQYRSFLGARRFLGNVVQYPGCGHFFSPASLVATDRDGKVAGVILCSTVAADTGHITQVCVNPEFQGKGVGYELLRNALNTLRDAGCTRTSLTVTASNTNAIQLYQRMGFRSRRRFAAYVWEGF
jgi:ribosomal protein S18 acetylase RimI-like enzyme